MDFDALEWPAMAHGAGVVTAERLNVRQAPITGQVKGVLRQGEHVIVWSALPNEWYLVQADASGLTGWVYGAWIRLDGELVREVRSDGAR